MAKTISKPSTSKPSVPKSTPTHEKGGKIHESRHNGTGPRTPKGK